jgi:prepilin-type N-terminal cleavage/methylation domain-containing protein
MLGKTKQLWKNRYRMRTQFLTLQQRRSGRAGDSRRRAAFTLPEVVISIMVVGLALGGILGLYIQSAVRSEWSAHSVAAHMLAMSRLDQCRAAKFDPRGSPPTDQLVSSNFPSRLEILDVGTSSGLVTYGTLQTTITTISTNPSLKMVRVDCAWSFPRKGRFTNSVYTYRAPNQ